MIAAVMVFALNADPAASIVRIGNINLVSLRCVPILRSHCPLEGM